MDRLRLWIASLALVCFLAGGAGGLLVARGSRPGGGALGPFEDYRRMFAAHFDLSPERARLMGELLRNYHKDIEDVRQRALEASMSDLEPDLNRLGLRYRDLIRNHVLPEDQRAEFDRLAAASPWPTVPSP